MKVFATADIHGNQDIIRKFPYIANDVDMIFICGDNGGKNYISKTFIEFTKYQKENALRFNDTLHDLAVPAYFILGNDDWFEIKDTKNYLTVPKRIDTHTLVPYEWVYLTPFNTNREANENKLKYELNKLEVDENTIIVAHGPPKYCCDRTNRGEYVGSIAVRDFIIEKRPKLWLCGHIHEAYGIDSLHNTTVVNCACDFSSGMLRGYVIDLDTLECQQMIL
jgi:Icc-related predicted phosphoesterase